MFILDILLSFVKGLPPKVIIVISGLLFGALVGLYAHHEWYQEGYSDCKNQALKSSIILKEKYDAIATNRPDTDSLIRSLRSGKF